MRIEGRDFVDFGQRHLHLGGERGQMRGGQMTVVILNQMKMLDQQIAPARAICEQRAHIFERPWGRPGGLWACAAAGGGPLAAAPSRPGLQRSSFSPEVRKAPLNQGKQGLSPNDAIGFLYRKDTHSCKIRL